MNTERAIKILRASAERAQNEECTMLMLLYMDALTYAASELERLSGLERQGYLTEYFETIAEQREARK